jgi:hypothetical protein
MRFRWPFRRKGRTSEGFTTKSFKGVQVASENHSDGSVTICKEMVAEILANPNVSEEVKELFRFTPASILIGSDAAPD